jgi:uncharacterized protein
MRVVFDTNTVVSALLFGGSMDWLVTHWQSGLVTPLVSSDTREELLRVLNYSKFGLTKDKIETLTNRYLPFVEHIDDTRSRPQLPQCRDRHDQKFIELAAAGKADALVSGDSDLLDLREDLPFAVKSPKEYRAWFLSTIQG